MEGSTFVNALVTFICSYLSLIGSMLIIISYAIARTKSTPKSAFLILHLATSDFFWFLAASVMATVWLANDGAVPDGLCYIVAPVISFTRMSSLVWTVVISFNMLMSVKKRKWFWKTQEVAWERYRRNYFAIAFILAFPGTIMTIISQQEPDGGSNGCSPGYEPIGVWYFVVFTELLPIILGFLCNLYVFLRLRRKFSKTAFPLSVRKRRKRIMYQYIIICMICWIPTIALYLLEISGLHSYHMEIISRTSLYISGFLNFLVFGMQDPHLKRSFDVVLYHVGIYSLCYGHNDIMYSANTQGTRDAKEFYSVQNMLKSSDVEKVVMFQEESLVKNADNPKDRNNIYRTRKLSREQKQELYAERPDLNPKFKTKRSGSKDKDGTSSSSGKKRSGKKVQIDPAPETEVPDDPEAALKTPLLTASHNVDNPMHQKVNRTSQDRTASQETGSYSYHLPRESRDSSASFDHINISHNYSILSDISQLTSAMNSTDHTNDNNNNNRKSNENDQGQGNRGIVHYSLADEQEAMSSVVDSMIINGQNIDRGTGSVASSLGSNNGVMSSQSGMHTTGSGFKSLNDSIGIHDIRMQQRAAAAAAEALRDEEEARAREEAEQAAHDDDDEDTDIDLRGENSILDVVVEEDEEESSEDEIDEEDEDLMNTPL